MRASDNRPPWVPLTSSIMFVLRHGRIFGWSLLLVTATGLLTWMGYVEALDFITGLTGHFFQQPPVSTGIRGWLVVKGWSVLKLLFFLVIRIVAFYLSFLIAYCLTTPGYVLLSTAVEKIYLGPLFVKDQGFSMKAMLRDIFEGCKIGLVGLAVTVVALVANFIPVGGLGFVLLIYTLYSALMFIDYPASRHRWTLGRKILWVRRHLTASLRLGFLPALVSMIPLVNIFFMALLFPLFTVHTTLNFIAIERWQVTEDHRVNR